MNIFQISTDYIALSNAIIENGGELTPELEQALQINQEQLQAKGIQYGYVIKSMAADIAIIDTEIERLTALKKSRQKTVERIKSTLQSAMELYGVTEIKTPTLSITFRKSESVVILDSDIIPKEYTRVSPPVISPDKDLIKKAIKEGHPVIGAELAVKNNIQIK